MVMVMVFFLLEVNVLMGKIVVCLMVGFCGILFVVILFVGKELGLDEEGFIKGLFVVVVVGIVIGLNVMLLGVEGGC